MDIQSITSSLGVFGNAATQGQQPAQAAQEARQPENQVREQREPQAQGVTEAAAKPVTNALGQKTGTLISVTA